MSQILDLSSANDIGIGNDEAFARLGYNAELGVSFCHGLSVALALSDHGETGWRPDIGRYLEAVAELEVGAEVQARLALQASPNVLKEIGLFASAHVAAKAYVRARLGLGMRLEEIIGPLQRDLPPLPFNILKAFVDDSALAAGFEATGEVAATAKAELVAQGRLIPTSTEEAGFDFRIGGGAAFIYGLEFDFFLRSRLPSPEVLLGKVATLLTEDVRDALLDENDEPAERQVKSLVVSVFGTGLSVLVALVGKKAGFQKASTDSLVEFGRTVSQDVLNATLDTVAERIRSEIEAVLFSEDGLSFEQSEALERLRALPEDPGVALLAGEVVGAVLAFLPEDRRDELRRLHVFATAFLVVLGVEDARAIEFDDEAQRLIEDATGHQALSIDDAAFAREVLAGGALESVLEQVAPALPLPLASVLDGLEAAGVKPGEFVALTFVTDRAARDEAARLALGLLQGLFEQHVIPTVMGAIGGGSGTASWREDYSQGVIRPTLFALSRMILPTLALLLDKPHQSKEEVQKLSTAVNHVGYGFIGRSALFFGEEVVGLTIDRFTTRAQSLRAELHSQAGHDFVEGFVRLVEEEIEDLLGLDVLDVQDRVRLRDETILLLDAVLGCAFKAMGNETWTPQRREDIFDGLEAVLLSPDGDRLDYERLPPDEILKALSDIVDCEFRPVTLNSPAMEEMKGALRDIVTAQLSAFLRDMPAAASRYAVAAFKILVAGSIKALIDALEEALEEALLRLRDLKAKLEAEIKALEAAIEAFKEKLEDELGQLVDDLETFLNAYFDELDALLDLSDLSWLDDIEDFILGLPGIDAVADFFGVRSDEAAAKDALEAARQEALSALRPTVAKTRFENLARTNGLNDTTWNAWFKTHVLPPRVTATLDAMAFDEVGLSGDAPLEALFKHRDLYAASEGTARATGTAWGTAELQLTNRRANLGEVKAELRLQESLQRSRTGSLEMRITSPAPIHLRGDDDFSGSDSLPLLGKEVYVEIEVVGIDASTLLQSNLAPHVRLKAADGTRRSPHALRDRATSLDLDSGRYTHDFRLFLNAAELDPEGLRAAGGRVYGYLDRRVLKQGRNELFVTLARGPGAPLVRHVTFYADLTRRDRPSNVIYLDPVGTVFDSPGDDHADAWNPQPGDQEVVVVRNDGHKNINLEGYELSDAHGHAYVFARRKLKPSAAIHLPVGMSPGPAQRYWLERNYGWPIAVLNNRGECLRLRQPDGIVISQLFYGSPRSNPDCNFLEVIG